MKNFTKDVLILLPKPEAYYSKDEVWKLNLRKSIQAAIEFSRKVIGASPVMFSSDEVAVSLYGKDKTISWWNALPPEDCNFARRNCDNLQYMPEGKDFEDEYATARANYPIKGYLEPESRFNIASKREKYVSTQLIKKCKMVISFENQNNATYKVNKNLVKDRAVFIVNPLTFTVSSFYSGQPIDITGFTGHKWTMLPMHSWEVINE